MDDELTEMIYDLAKDGWDFTLNRNAELIDDGKCWVRFHRLGQYGMSDGKTDVLEAVREAYFQAKQLRK